MVSRYHVPTIHYGGGLVAKGRTLVEERCTVTGIRAVVFDMDGTLVHSDYDWPAIRSELGAEGPSIIDALNALPTQQKADSWRRLEAIEREASQRAQLVDGTRNLLELLAKRRVKTALVTNNTTENAEILISRFSLSFDVVLTRDSGFYKPYGAPMVEAMKRLGVAPCETVAVGDSLYDVNSAREAECAEVIIVNGGCREFGHRADKAFENLMALSAYFETLF